MHLPIAVRALAVAQSPPIITTRSNIGAHAVLSVFIAHKIKRKNPIKLKRTVNDDK